MSYEKTANLARTNLNVSIDNVTTTIVVIDASTFPSSPQFRIIVDQEIMIVTGVSGTTWTVTRGAEGTTAVSHTSGATVVLVLTSGALPQMWSDHGFTSSSLGDRKPASTGTYDEEFEGTADTLPTNWSWSSSPSAPDSFTVNSTWPSLLMLEGTGNTTYTLTRSSFAPGAGNFGIWWKVFNGAVTGTDVQDLTIYIKDSAGGEGRAWQIYAANANALDIKTLSLISSVEATWGSGVVLGGGQSHLFGGLTRTSGNVWTAWYSVNGVAWIRHSTATHSFTVNKIEFHLGTTSDQSRMAIDWIRYRADVLFPIPG